MCYPGTVCRDGGWAERKERAFFYQRRQTATHNQRRFSSVEFAHDSQNLFQRDATDQQCASDSCISGMKIGICNGHKEFWMDVSYQFIWC